MPCDFECFLWKSSSLRVTPWSIQKVLCCLGKWLLNGPDVVEILPKVSIIEKQSKKYMTWHYRDFILETQIFEVLKTNRIPTRKINDPGEDLLRARVSRTLPHSWKVRDHRRRGIYAIIKKTLVCCQESCLLGLGMWLSDRVLSSAYQGPVSHSQHFPNKNPDFLVWLTTTHN